MNRFRYLFLAAAALPLCAQNDWPGWGHDGSNQRHSPLKQITAANVSKLAPAWQYPMKIEPYKLSQSTPLVVNGVIYSIAPWSVVFAVDAKTGKAYWTHDMLAAIWGSPIVIDGKVYLGDEDGDVAVLATGRTKKVLFETNLGSSIYSTPVPANGSMFIVNRNQLIAIGRREFRNGLLPASIPSFMHNLLKRVNIHLG